MLEFRLSSKTRTTGICIAAVLGVVLALLIRIWHGPFSTSKIVPLTIEEIASVEYIPVMSGYELALNAIIAKDGSSHGDLFLDAIETNVRPELHNSLAPIVAAIRYAENGGKGREYGILHPRVEKTYRSQAGWCAATVQKNWDRYITAGGVPTEIDSFILFLGERYCPIGASNDPNGLNTNWVGNVIQIRNSLSTGGLL